MYYVGLDVHMRRSSLEILDSNGKSVKCLEFKGSWPQLVQTIEQQVPRPFAICYEASCGYGYLHDRLSKLSDRVAVAHPGQLRLIFKSKRKNDRIDRSKLAKLLYLDAVPQVHVPSIDVRQWRASIEWRQSLLARRVAVKNQLRAILRSIGLTVPRNLWSEKGLAWLKEQELSEIDQLRREMLLEELQDLKRKIALVEKHLAKIADRHPGITLLRTIPGVGIRTAEAFCAYVDDIKRFARTNQVPAYFGLVPCQDSSADVNRLGHITRDGPSTVRKLLCEAAWQGVRRDPTLKALFERISAGKSDRRKIALVAVAHHLVRVMSAMLRSGECWRGESKRARENKISPPEDSKA
jgi:transposase